MAVGTAYRVRAIGIGKNIVVYAKSKEEANFREIGMLAQPTVPKGSISFTSTYPAEVDNIEIYVDKNKDLVAEEKIAHVAVGETEKLAIRNAKNVPLSWSSSNEAVATVDAEGNVAGVGKGFAVVSVKDQAGKEIENCGVYVFNPIKTMHFTCGDTLTMYEGDTVGFTITPNPINAQAIVDWTISDESIAEFYGTSFLRRALTGLKPGEVVVTAKEQSSGISISCNVSVLPEAQRPKHQTTTSRFYLSGNKHEIPNTFMGFHIVPSAFTNSEAFVEAFKDLHIQNYRPEQDLLHGFVPDGNWKNTLDTYKLESFHQETGTPMIFVVEGFNNMKTYTDDEILEQVKYMRERVKGELIVELGNEVYAIAYEDHYPTAEDYFQWAARLAKKIKEFDPTIKCIAIGFDYGGESDILSDPHHQNTLKDDMAYTQAHRVQEWNQTAFRYKDAFDGLTVHSYFSVGNLSGINAEEFLRRGLTFNYDAYYSALNIYYRSGETMPLYFTEYGSLDGEIFWGTNMTAEDKTRMQWQVYPGIAIRNMEHLMNYIKTGVVEAVDFHDLYDSQGFQVYNVPPDKVKRPMPNYHVFKEAGTIFHENPVFYDLKGEDMAYDVVPRPYYNGNDTNDIVDYVEAWGFGDAEKVKKAVFMNHTNAPQKVSIAGAQIKPTWSYGGTIEELMPDFLRNRKYESFNSRLQEIEGTDELLPYPTVHEAAFADEIELPPYTIMTVEVSGAAELREGSTAGKITKLAEYHLRHGVALMIDHPEAYVDNAKRLIDAENPSVSPIVKENRTLIPLRFVAESFGCDVAYTQETGNIKINSDHVQIELTVGEKKYTVNGAEMEFDVPAEVIEDRTLVPLRALVEALGKELYWDARGLIVITYPKAGFVTSLEWNNAANATHIDSIVNMFEQD